MAEPPKKPDSDRAQIIELGQLTKHVAQLTWSDLINEAAGDPKKSVSPKLRQLLPKSESPEETERQLQNIRDLVVRELLQRVVELHKLGLDPLEFSELLNRDQDRDLKKQFGIAFFIAAVVFTLASYVIIVWASVGEWKLPPAALTALIVQAPLQLFGILLVIARNLFPGDKVKKGKKKTKPRKAGVRPPAQGGRQRRNADPAAPADVADAD